MVLHLAWESLKVMNNLCLKMRNNGCCRNIGQNSWRSAYYLKMFNADVENCEVQESFTRSQDDLHFFWV